MILAFNKESFQGKGLLHARNVVADSTYFSPKMPYGFTYRNDFYGFNTHVNKSGKCEVTGLWKLNIGTSDVTHFPIPQGFRFDSLLSVLPAPDSTITIVGVENDSIIKILHFDSLLSASPVFTAPAAIKAVHYIKNRLEFVFGRQHKLVGSIGAVGDSSVIFRKYELPGFFDRICEIVAAWPEKDKWRFLLSTDYHRKNEKWVLMENKNKTNFLVFDERAVYPDYPGMVEESIGSILRQFDYTLSGLAPRVTSKDSVLKFDGRAFSFARVGKSKACNMAWFILQPPAKSLRIVQWDNIKNGSGFVSSQPYLSQPDANLPFVSDSGKYIFHVLGNPDRKQIFLDENESPIGYFQLNNDSVFLLTSRLNMAFLNDEGKLLDRKNFFTLVNTTILRNQPGAIHLLETDFPSARALTLFVLLYGLLPLWVISMVIIWLIEAVREKPKFSVRERPWSFSMRLMPGSVVYMLLLLFNILLFLGTFAIRLF